MKRMLIIHPHWPPSNTVGVHRVRLISNALHEFGWKAVVVTIDENDCEEPIALDTNQLVEPEVEVFKVRANPVKKILGKRLIGDIGIRGWQAMRRKAKEILEQEQINFIWFSLPSWYTPLMGSGLSRQFKVPFGMDYRDPWVYELADHQKGLNRATFTVAIARILEPIALRNIAIISGVSEGYLAGVKERYRKMQTVPSVTFQMGFSRRDHFINLPDFHPPFKQGKRSYVYAGAYSPNWTPLFTLWLKALARIHEKNPLRDVEILFIGTGNPELHSLQSIANGFGLNGIVRELPERISFLEVQQILRLSSGTLVIGSIEPHYSASKVFQCLITSPRVFGFFHEASEASIILHDCDASDFYVGYHPSHSEKETLAKLEDKIERFLDPKQPWRANLDALEEHTAQNNANKFIKAIEQFNSISS